MKPKRYLPMVGLFFLPVAMALLLATHVQHVVLEFTLSRNRQKTIAQTVVVSQPAETKVISPFVASAPQQPEGIDGCGCPACCAIAKL